MTDNETFATADAAIAAAQAWLLENCEVWFRDAGADEAQVARVRELFERTLRETQASAIAMLECRAKSVQ